MRNYIILNGKNSNEINGLLIQELPPISKPLIRTEVEEIDGRDGDIVTPLGYSAYDKEFTIGLYKDFDVNEVAAYFNSEGTVIFSNEPDKYYYYQITAQIDFERLVRYRTATVTMHCQPFKYSATEQPITEDVSGTVSDEGTNLALENTAEAPFNTLDLKGNTSQQTYSGKNLMPYPYDGGGQGNGITFTANSDGSVTLNGKNNNSGNSSYRLQANITLQAGTYYFIVPSNTDVMFSAYDGSRYYDIHSSNNYTLTLSAATTLQYIIIQVARGRTSQFSNYVVYPMMTTISGQTAADYEPYVGGVPAPNPDYPQAVKVVTGENVVKITGKNLLKIYTSSFNRTVNGVTASYDENTGIVALNGTCTANNTAFSFNTSSNGFSLDGAYTLSYEFVGGSISNATSNTKIQLMNSSYANQIGLVLGNSSAHSTATKNDKYIYNNIRIDNGVVLNNYQIRIQLEKGSTPTDFEPYQEQSYPISLGSIELCGLGDDGAGGYLYKDGIYKNLTDNKWYVRKEVGHTLYTGNVLGIAANLGSGETIASATGAFFIWVGDVGLMSENLGTLNGGAISGNADANAMTSGTFATRSGTPDRLYFRNTAYIGKTGNEMKAILASNSGGASIWHALATPTDTEITNEALIQQLDDIYYHAHAYKGRTHITSSAATGNVPHIIAAEVGEDNESTITNAGNYLSKPKITVYGSGDISLYINDMHVLQITLGDEGYITIDTAQMEAYKDTLDNLKNRLVIGDYSNARLKPGANKIHFTGTVTKYIVENYSRWL